MYALGCGIGPLIATLVAAAHEPSRWYFHYISLTGVGAVTLLLVVAAFYDSIRRTLDTGAQSSTFTIGSRRSPISATREVRNILGQKSVWILSLYFFFFLGTVITASGLYDRSILTRFWLTDYRLASWVPRWGKRRPSGWKGLRFRGYGHSTGTFLGRALLAEPTKCLGERRMILVYAILCLGLALIFWLVPNIIINAIAISLFGFFSGPFFATGVYVGSQLFPADQRVGSLSMWFPVCNDFGLHLQRNSSSFHAWASMRFYVPCLNWTHCVKSRGSGSSA